MHGHGQRLDDSTQLRFSGVESNSWLSRAEQVAMRRGEICILFCRSTQKGDEIGSVDSGGMSSHTDVTSRLSLHSSAALHSAKFNPHLPIGVLAQLPSELPGNINYPMRNEKKKKKKNRRTLPQMRFSKIFYCAQYLAGITANYSSSVDISKICLFFSLLEEAPPHLWMFYHTLKSLLRNQAESRNEKNI